MTKLNSQRPATKERPADERWRRHLYLINHNGHGNGRTYLSLYGAACAARNLARKWNAKVIEISRADDDVCWPTVAKVRHKSMTLRPAHMHHDAIW